ncbi:hypothetical protein LPJ61_000629 [Coemansia biformis]|uniref:Pre-rRNA-processing protein RIX1 n=1 Tax=Coemansia biformis TaxID=1286918 RepID=A0A9W7YJA3_9FUNG|nr:hypothetical protein LPJ61_000629 [Coemansia biformis]
MEASVARAERTLSLLTGTYLANAEATKANMALVLDVALSQNLFVYGDAAGTTEETAKRYASAVHKWLARINSLAAGKTSESRLAGVLLMKQTALQSPSIFSENAPRWTTALLNMLGKAETTPLFVAVLQTLVMFVDAVRDVPVLYREIASAQVPRINQVVLAVADKSPELADHILEALMHSATWYPTLFRPSVDKAEALCLRLLDASGARSDPATRERAALCMAALSLPGGKVSTEERWFQLAQQAVGTLKQCIDHIMCVNPPSNGAETHLCFALSALPDDYTASIPRAADRISAMSDVVVALLTQPTAADIPIPAASIAGAALKLAMVPVRVASSKSTRVEFALVSPLAPQLQRAAIRIMAALAIALGGHMQPLLSTVARAATAVNTQNVSSPVTRVALQSLVRLYIEKYGFGFAAHLPYELVTSVVDDICVQHGARRVAGSAAAIAAPAGTAPQQKKRSSNGASRVAGVGEPLIHWNDVVLSALRTVLAFLQHTPTALCSALRTRVDSNILALVMLGTTGGIEMPFASRQSDAPFKVQLYKCLEASVLSPDPWQKAILPHAVAAFHAGLADPSGAVQAACQRALAAVDPVIHARLPAQLREPDSEEGFEAEAHVPRMLRAEGSAVSISAVLSGTHLGEQLDVEADGVNPANDALTADSAKRSKHDALGPATPSDTTAARAAAPTPDVSGGRGNGDGDESEGEAIPDIVMEESDSDVD